MAKPKGTRAHPHKSIAATLRQKQGLASMPLILSVTNGENHGRDNKKFKNERDTELSQQVREETNLAKEFSSLTFPALLPMTNITKPGNDSH